MSLGKLRIHSDGYWKWEDSGVSSSLDPSICHSGLTPWRLYRAVLRIEKELEHCVPEKVGALVRSCHSNTERRHKGLPIISGKFQISSMAIVCIPLSILMAYEHCKHLSMLE